MSIRVGIDVGGTFTDLAAFDPDTGAVHVSKSPSTPQDPVQGVLAVIEKVGIAGDEIQDIVHGTTVATNALLERKKAMPGLITTKGFRDVVFIQRMNRRHHYDLQWDKPRPFVERRNCLEVDERTNYQGDILIPLDEDGASRAVLALRRRGIRDIAVSFLFSYVNPVNELRMREIIEHLYPEATVSLSHEVYPRWREYDRTSTTLADAFLKSLIAEYVENLAKGLENKRFAGNFLIMKSNGGVEEWRAAAAKPVDLLISGPVGGVLSALFFGRLLGRENVISMDMGGTSFDVSLIANGQVRRTTEYEIEWGLPVYTPMTDVKTIGAGGGSIAWIDKGGLLRVGPGSAGALPGPACYGRGGVEATVTDANLVLGRINPRYFLGGEMELDVDAARAALLRLGKRLDMSAEQVAYSIIQLVDFSMVDAIRLVSIDRGVDPREFTLLSFGGAGSLHAAALAEMLGIREVIVPIHQGVFSAFGLMTADMRVDESVTASFRSDVIQLDRVNMVLARLRERALGRLRAEGFAGAPVLAGAIEMRYLGQNYGTDIGVPMAKGVLTRGDLNGVFSRFHAEHRRLYGYAIPAEIIELVHFKVTAVGPTEKPALPILRGQRETVPKGERRVYFRAGSVATRLYARDGLSAGAQLEGPVVIEEAMSTTLVHPGQSLQVDAHGNLIISTTVGP